MNVIGYFLCNKLIKIIVELMRKRLKSENLIVRYLGDVSSVT